MIHEAKTVSDDIDSIVLKFRDGRTLSIRPEKVTHLELSYEESTRKVSLVISAVSDVQWEVEPPIIYIRDSGTSGPKPAKPDKQIKGGTEL